MNEICVPVDFTFGEIEDIEVFVDSESIGLNYQISADPCQNEYTMTQEAYLIS